MNYKLYENSLNDTSQVIQTVLLNRGIEDPDVYLSLDSSYCNDYENLNNIEDAVKCFDKHFESKNNIAILVDCDPDGYTSAAAIYNYIKRLDPNYPVQHIIHHNNKAHGLSKMGKGDFDLTDDTKLFIIPDAGSNDVRQLRDLIDRGIDCICLDHHEIEDWVGECDAIIVNNQASDNYTCKDFSGVGVVYEFLRALDDYYLYDYADDFLDLVAFGNISDVMSIKNCQTRYYIEQGMRNIQNKFLKALDKAQAFSTKGEINIHNIQWYWTPICNGLLRVGSYEDRDLLFRAFIETDEVFEYKKRDGSIVDEDIYTRAARLCKNAKSRQDKLRDDLFVVLQADVDPEDKVVMVVTPDGIDQGIIGLSAMKLCDAVQKPCIILRDQGGGVYSGSARNCNHSPVKDFKELVNSTRLFDYAQGHPGAFGVSIYEDNIMDARDVLNDALENIEYDETIYCDFILNQEDLTYQFIKTIDDSKWLYGTGIDEPMIAIENVVASVDMCATMGANKDSVTFVSGGIKYCKFRCKQDESLLDFANGWIAQELVLNVVGRCSINVYKGAMSAQFVIEDYEVVSMS